MLHAESEVARDHIMRDMMDCIDFASNCECPWTHFAPLTLRPVQTTQQSLALHACGLNKERIR